MNTTEKPNNNLTNLIQESKNRSIVNEETTNFNNAFEFLKSLKPYSHRFSSNEPIERKPSEKIFSNHAASYTNRFRGEIDNEFVIPISWCFDKEALINLLGITSYEHFPEVNGVRFYAGVNNDNQLTLIAVSTKAGSNPTCSDCNDDLTEEEEYPYYDYADPCPNNCSSTGNLKEISNTNMLRRFKRIE